MSLEQDQKQLKEYIKQDHDQQYLSQFGFAHLAMLDIIDMQANEKDKERLAAALETLTEKDLDPLQVKIDKAIMEFDLATEYKGTERQQQILSYHKNNIDLNKLVSRKADNNLLTNYLIVQKGMPVSNELKRNLHANGHDKLLKVIDGLQENQRIAENQIYQDHQEHKQIKKQKFGLKM